METEGEQAMTPDAELLELRQRLTRIEREREAIAAVLQIVSRSDVALDDALQAIAGMSREYCHADIPRIWLLDAEDVVIGPLAGTDEFRLVGERLNLTTLDPTAIFAVALRTGETVHAPDRLADARAR